jgi:hypothetical protein
MIPRSILPMIWAYDILAGGDALTEADRTAFANWLRALVPQLKEGALYWKKNGYFDAQYFQNHLAGENMGLVAIGITCGDAELLSYAVNSAENTRDFLDLVEGLILMPGDEVYYRDLPGAPAPQAGEIIDRYRHFQMAGHVEGYVSKPNRGLQYAMLSSHLLELPRARRREPATPLLVLRADLRLDGRLRAGRLLPRRNRAHDLWRRFPRHLRNRRRPLPR